MASIISASASDHGEGMLSLEERRQQREQIINGELKAKSAEPTVTNAIYQQRKAVIVSNVQRGEKRENPANTVAVNHGYREHSARKVSVDCIEILDDDDIEELEQCRPPQLQQQQPALIEMDDDDEIRVIEEPIPPPKRAKFDGINRALQREQRQPQQEEHSPVPEDPKNSTIEQSKCPNLPMGSSSSSSTNTAQSAQNATTGSTTIQANNQLKEKPPTKPKTDEAEGTTSANSSPTKSAVQLINYETLLDRLEEYVHSAIENGQNVDRKVLDALLAAINIQVQKEPYSVRKLILDKQLVLPNTISFPPSQVVDMIVEHDPDHQLTRVINRIFGEERPKLTENERRERQQLKAQNPASNMTRVLLEIGQDLVQESTYYDIVHARNLPEQPRNMETYKQVAAQLKPVWEALKTKNLPHKLKTFSCQVCGFKTDSKIVLTSHKQMLHLVGGRRYQCTYCPEFDTNEYRITQHILEEHGIKPINPSELDGDNGQIHCPICDENFHYKVQRDQHLKMCRRDLYKVNSIQAGRSPMDINAINRWLWDKPQIEPSVLNQNESQQRQQQIRQQQIILQQQKQAQAKAAAILAAHAQSSRSASRIKTYQPGPGTIGMGIGGIGQQRGGGQQQQRMVQSQSSRPMTIFPQQITSTKPNNMLPARSMGSGPIPAMSSMLTAAGGALHNSALSARMGFPPPNGQQQKLQPKPQPQQISASKNLGAALAAMGFTGLKQPSVGEILRSARLANSNLTPPQIIQAAIQAKAMQMQATGTKTSSSSTATTAMGAGPSRSLANVTGTSGLAPQSQRLPARMVPSKKLPAAPILTPQESGQPQLCEICDQQIAGRESFRLHIQAMHKLLMGKKASDMAQGATLACSRCRERFWTYEGLERHLVMAHGLVTADLLTKAQERADGGKCKLCGKQYAFNLLQHLATDHSIKLCSAEIMYSCDVCSFKCSSYQKLEIHLTEKHPKN